MLHKMFYLPILQIYHSIYFQLMCLRVGWGTLAQESGHEPMGPPRHPGGTATVQHVLPGDADAQEASPALQAHFNPLLVPS